MKFEIQAKLFSQDISNNHIKFHFYDECFNYGYCDKKWSIYIGMRYLTTLLQKCYFDRNLHFYYYKIVNEFDNRGDNAFDYFYGEYQKSYEKIKIFYINEI